MKDVENSKSNKLTGSLQISGFTILKGKRVVIALQGVYGVGLKTALEIMKKFNIPLNQRMGLVDESTVHLIREYVKKQEEQELLGNSLKRKRINSITRLKVINSYRGQRHIMGLPCRGQNTHSNNKRIKRIAKNKKDNKR